MKDVAAGVARFLPTARRSIDYYTRVFPNVDPGEIESVVMFALYQCVVRYDPGRGSFRAMFQPRAHGAVRDAARHDDPHTRDDRFHLTHDELRPDGSAVVEIRSRSLDEPRSKWDQDENTAVTYHESYGAEDPALAELLEFVGDIDVTSLMRHLPTRERLLVYLHYFEGLGLTEIGRDYLGGVSPSRACQIHVTALSRMRRASRGPGRVVR